MAIRSGWSSPPFTQSLNLFDISKNIAQRLTGIFYRTRMGEGRSSAAIQISRMTPTGANTSTSSSISMPIPALSLGASHQTGWTGLVAASSGCSAAPIQRHFWKQESGIIQPGYLNKAA
jgi:hypothetical protein